MDQLFQVGSAFDLLMHSQKQSEVSAQSFSLEFFIDNTLYLAGYKTPNDDLKKPDGLLSDHQHLRFANNCPIVISDDVNFRRKLLEACVPGSKLVVDASFGINFLFVLSGLAN